MVGVITTNYDTVLENIFSDFEVMVGQDNLLLSNALNIFEIFKIHGCFSEPDSIIITEKDYNYFEQKLKYLSAKLLTIFVENPIIFIGYGMGDVNIRNILKEISSCLTREQLNRIKDNFIFISRSRDGTTSIKKREIEFESGNIEMTEFILNDYGILYESFSHIQSTLPVKLTRKLQDMVCNYVYSVEAHNNIIFGDIDSPDIDDSAVALYFGKKDMVSQVGFSNFTIDDILEDILFDNKPYLMNIQLIEKTFPTIRSKGGSTLLPVYKYIRGLNYSLASIPDDYNIIKSYNDKTIQPNSSERRTYLKDDLIFSTIKDIETKFPKHIYKQIAYIKKYAQTLSVNELEIYLKKSFYSLKSNSDLYQKYISYLRKLIAIYDFKRYSVK